MENPRQTGSSPLTTSTTAAEKHDSQRPEHPEFWDKRFNEGITPWNAGGVPNALRQFIGHPSAQTQRVLIPGCGHGWEASWLAAQGLSVTALDFSEAAIATARQTLGDWPGTLVCDDFFTYQPTAPFDLIYERAFLCALPRKLWAAYGERMHRLTAENGRLFGFFFFSEELKGPPFGIGEEALDALLSPWFDRKDDQAVADSIPVFAGRERWQVWRRRA